MPPAPAKITPLPSRSRKAGWLQHAQLDERGKVLGNLDNVMRALRSTPELVASFAFDEMLRAPVLISPLPLTSAVITTHIEPDVLPRPVRDTDVSQLQEWLQQNGLPRIGFGLAHQAMTSFAWERRFHPVRDYLEALRWDEVRRLYDWTTVYLGAQRTEYHCRIGEMFIIAMVARIFQPGAKADYMLVMEGPQGSRKSTACKILGGRWFSDSLPDVTSGKDVSQHLRDNWLIGIPEMSAMSKTETAALKAFVSRTEEVYRPSYGRMGVHEPRQCLFVGTINKSNYLRDETGARRFWPVKVGTIDIAALARDRDQLFAEAVRAFHARKPWWPDTKFEREHILPEQSARFETDAWAEPISAYIASKRSVTVGEIGKEVLRFENRLFGKAHTNRIMAVLEHLGWQRSDKKNSAGSFPWLRP